MSYVLKCWNWNFRRISNLYFLLNFQLKKKTVKEFCILWHLQAIRCLNSKEIMLKSSIRVTCTFYRSDFFSAENERENKDSKFDANYNIRRQFQLFEYDMILRLIKSSWLRDQRNPKFKSHWFDRHLKIKLHASVISCTFPLHTAKWMSFLLDRPKTK